MFLNLDAGELEEETAALWSLVDVLNCACGGHAGDSQSMARVAMFCSQSGLRGSTPVRLGAHPGYPDREHFGRRSIACATIDLSDAVAAQCTALARIAADAGMTITYIKPHGALYHDAAAMPARAEAVTRGAIAALGTALTVIGPPDGALRVAAERLGLRYAREGFADRRTRADGSLVPREEPDALITNPAEAARQAAALLQRTDTIGLHADTPGALEIARAVREVVRG